MNISRKLVVLIPTVLCCVLATVWAAPFEVDQTPQATGNSYYLYTSLFKIDESGVVPVPSRFRWSVETSWRGVDEKGQDLPDSRVMLRLYDPNRNCTALTAQMDLDTAAQLQRELAAVIAKKRADPSFQHRPQLYDSKEIPTKRIVGVDESKRAIVEDGR